MTHDSLVDRDWLKVVALLGGAAALQESARETGAFQRARGVKSAADLLRLVLAYCLGDHGLRLTAAWANAVGLADISNVALLNRLRRCGGWLTVLIGQVLASTVPGAGRGRLIRLIDATSVCQAGAAAKRGNGVWRIHGAFDVPNERFAAFLLTDQHEPERLDRVAVVPGEIRIADRVYLQADRIAAVCEQGADVVVRAGWKRARWLDAAGAPLDLPGLLRAAAAIGWIDQPIWLARAQAPALALRLVAVRKSEPAIAAARRQARRAAQRAGVRVSEATLIAAEWVMVVTSLGPADYSAADVLALYRLRWRIELAFKRLKSLIGLRGPPGFDERSARPYVLAHLLIALLLEPMVDVLEDSPRWANAA